MDALYDDINQEDPQWPLHLAELSTLIQTDPQGLKNLIERGFLPRFLKCISSPTYIADSVWIFFSLYPACFHNSIFFSLDLLEECNYASDSALPTEYVGRQSV